VSTPAQWLARGRHLELADGRIFAVDLVPREPRTPGAGPVLILHGYPVSSWSFADAAELLARERRVVLFDLLGFGFSAKPADAAYSVFEHADVAIAVARTFGLSRVHIWAHDMGASVATELVARRERGLLPFEIASLALMNGGIYVEMSRPTLGQRMLMSRAGPALSRLAGRSRTIFLSQMRRTFGRQPAPGQLESIWAMQSRDDGVFRMPATIRFMQERARFRRRWIGALRRIDLPVLVGWGASDPVTPLAVAERLARETPGSELVAWPGLGHYPQVEDPPQVAAAVAAFMTRVEGVPGKDRAALDAEGPIGD